MMTNRQNNDGGCVSLKINEMDTNEITNKKFKYLKTEQIYIFDF